MAGNLDDLDLQHSDDDGQLPADHNKLLGAVSQLYEKKRVKAPTRKEPSLEVSEFHLSQPDKKQGRVKVTELAKVLNKRAVHAEIGHKLKVARKRARTLPRPLEKYHADQITRAAGYEHAKRQLNRWDAVVYQHKVAEQLRFPLKNETVRVHQETTDVSKLFRISDVPYPFTSVKEYEAVSEPLWVLPGCPRQPIPS
ncbi:U3 small nucleolar RNA-associated protein 14 homolog A [Macrosteles quadrilineatus]|uniref:U3 small nucleolar RNA-associated protein 14 homolog A n=1 Tax=Macrosteles quadrilineatus TaxID=74068 RepID=UPI0023E0BF24|nr:U3 small nucleolar RNA-associated protein 14 homolog A [Macrosteles quadrilineatus]